MSKITPKARRIIFYCNLLELGINIDFDKLDSETLYYIEYFGIRRKQKEEEERFRALFKGLQELLKFK